MKTYVHTQTPRGRSLGFSAQIEQGAETFSYGSHTDEQGRMVCAFRLTFCNSKDKHFNKKIARNVLAEKEPRIVRVVDLPRLLAEAEADAQGVKNEDWFDYVEVMTTGYNYILRRFV